jgi:DNA polymerase III subunit gamma/tau
MCILEDFVNLAEKMRPKNLDDVIGNKHIVSALRRQFDTNQISQTIMFTGDAGSGKTSFAKIVATHLNAEIIEIDCGADGSIDNMRELVESVSLSSLFSSHKVFILDEVHALSKPGQSALLKTLEDPQKNVNFILLTTDPGKLLKTIRTRCVEYQTMPATVEEVGQAVKKVEEIYKVRFESRSDLWSLVEQSGGSFRQVYAFMEKLVAVSDNNGIITSDMFHMVLGKSMEHVDENLPKAFLSKDIHSAMSIVSNQRKENVNPVGTLLGIYNYLKVVFLKNGNIISKDDKLMMADLSEKIAQKEITWETIESIIWKHI